ncbi:M28 family peptidase [Kocuria rhizosphaericola]|uniref:M28 family peptidase n=1 Tax=Kocuria rhizosphaericola TaxID=3376284 RepID=UPI0037AF2F90
MLLLVVVAAAVLAYLPLSLTPSPVPTAAPAHQFSAERAMTDLQRVAPRPRPMGSAAHQEAVATLQDELADLGVESEVVEKVVARPDFGTVFAARLRNVIARIPGTDSTGAVLLMSHFNSVPASPAANDGGRGGVTALETIRAIRATGPVRNDVIVWFGDADETTAMNTEALTDHRWFQDVELALAFGGIGTRGPSLLSFAGTGHPGTPLPPQAVGESTGVQLSGGSFSTEEGRWLHDALEVLPRPVPVLPFNDVALGAGPDLATAVAGTDIAALSFAQIGDTSGYHTDLDRPDRTALGSLQSSGDSALALVRHFGAVDLTAPAPTEGLVAFSAGPGRVVAYPVSWALPLAAAAGALVVVAMAVGRRRHVLTLTGALSGILACTVSTVLAAALAAAVTVMLRPEVHFARNPYGYGWRALLLVALGLACSAAVYLGAARLLRTAQRVLGMVTGPLVVLTAAAVVTGGGPARRQLRLHLARAGRRGPVDLAGAGTAPGRTAVGAHRGAGCRGRRRGDRGRARGVPAGERHLGAAVGVRISGHGRRRPAGRRPHGPFPGAGPSPLGRSGRPVRHDRSPGHREPGRCRLRHRATAT